MLKLVFFQVSTYTKGFTLIIEPSDDKTPNVVNPVSSMLNNSVGQHFFFALALL